MPSIGQFEGKNAAGLQKVYIILMASVTDIPTPDGLEISDDITSTAFTEINPIENGASFQEEISEDPNGDTYKYNIPVTINKDRKDITEALLDFSGRKCIAITVDNNDGTMRIIGSLEQPARLIWGSSKARQLSGKNGYNLTISCEMNDPAYYYTGSVTLV